MSIDHPLPAVPMPPLQYATLGGGCFWCLEAVYEDLQGVVDVESGYTGGSLSAPTYAQVCDGDTGHAEVVRVAFDPAVVAYREILEVFFTIHDPTTLNRQGNDAGTQYRSAIFCHDEAQRGTARAVIDELQLALPREVTTQVVLQPLPAADYFRAETYHQEYARHNPAAGYCMFVVAPKVETFRRTFANRRRTAPVA
jgi:peptide-methionine (S)-S-oxide reductase